MSEQDVDLGGIDIVVNTHLHFDHCGGNHLRGHEHEPWRPRNV